MKKIKLNVFFWIIIIVIVSYVIFALITNIDELEKEPYTSIEHGWRIRYPIGWEIIEVATGDVDFIDESSENILSIRVEPPKLFTSKTLDDEIDKIQELLDNDSYGFQEISQGYREINSMNSYEFIYKNEDGESSLKEKRILIQKDNRIFNIVYVAEIDLYDDYDSLAEKCIDTFTVL
jgi:hypothetical protein